MAALASRPSAGDPRPRALRWRYLAASGLVTTLLLAALAANELRASRRIITEAMAAGAASLVQAIARAGENAIRADAAIEASTATRLLAQARLLRELDRHGLLSDTAATRLAQEAALYRINVFDAAGRRVITNASDTHASAASPELADLLAGRVEERIIGFREGRFHAGSRFAAAVARDEGGAIVVNIDAAEMLDARREAGIGRLMQEIGANPGLVYIVLQDQQGVVLASRGVQRMERIAGDAFLEAALSGNEPRSRMTSYEGQDVFETVMPFWVDAESRGLIRLSLTADAMATAEARSRRRLAVWAGLLAVIGVVGVGWLAVRHNLAVLHESHERIQTYSSRLLEDMGDAVVAVDYQGRIDVYNRAAERLLRLPGTQVRASSVHVLGDLGQRLLASLHGERELRGEPCRCRAPDGRMLDLSVTLSLLRNRLGQTETAVAVIQDLTQRRALEAGLRRGERLAAMGELASGVAHEVRNPLNAIGLIAQRLQREFQPVADAEEYAQLTRTVRAEVERVNQIVRQFLALARPPALVRADTDVEQLLADTLGVVEAQAAHDGIRVLRDFSGVGCASVDPAQLKQALLNLLVNAVEALQPDGSGGAEDRSPSEEGVIQLTATRARDHIRIAVSDNGLGIPEPARERIFDLYYTTKPTGTGLGLGLVQRIVAEHGGSIAVDSVPGEGTTFTMQLPLQEA